jgi:precorrin-4 methylase
MGLKYLLLRGNSLGSGEDDGFPAEGRFDDVRAYPLGGDVAERNSHRSCAGDGAFQAASAAVKTSPPYDYDTSAVILTMAVWPGRTDIHEKLMTASSTMVFYTLLFDYPKVISQLQRYYPHNTPLAVMIDAGDRKNQQVIQSTIGRFLKEVDYKSLLAERHILLPGNFPKVGQARKDFVPQIEKGHIK